MGAVPAFPASARLGGAEGAFAAFGAHAAESAAAISIGRNMQANGGESAMPQHGWALAGLAEDGRPAGRVHGARAYYRRHVLEVARRASVIAQLSRRPDR